MTTPSPPHSHSRGSPRLEGNQDRWEIVESLKEAPPGLQEPDRHEGILFKRRKWPLKGWHKRYFLLERGILRYGKRDIDIQRGKIHGSVDVGLSVMTIKKRVLCIDLDTEDSILHLKVKSPESYEEWVTKLRLHRVFRQNEITIDPHDRQIFSPYSSSSPAFSDAVRKSTLTKQASIQQAKVNSWLHTSEDMENCSKELEECESYLEELNLLLKNMEVVQRSCSAPSISSLRGTSYEQSKKEKRPRRWRSRKEVKTTLQVPSCISPQQSRLHASHPNLSTTPEQEECPESPESPTDSSRLHADFYRLAVSIHSSLKSAHSSLATERDKLRNGFDLKTSFSTEPQGTPQSLVHQMSNESKNSITESSSEFFDAHEYLLSSSSSENEVSDDDSYVSDVSDTISMDTVTGTRERINSDGSSAAVIPRRSTLPSPSPASSVSLWNILRNNIGKDLSKVAMPVQLNEPLNTLQRLCEELEYSELLDTANQTLDPCQRMVYVATFAVSSYASSYYRAGSKPFNPLLGETYECDRPDKGFRFIAEQVSHHPPVSASHCESPNFSFWQDARWKNKFWGKSMEIVPIGTTHLTLPAFGDHYEWNKVTTCIHNILSGQRWVEHYGEMSIKNVNSDACQCKITFIKARTWSSTVNEIHGIVTNSQGKVVHSIFGKWHESLFLGDPPTATCVWKANPMPILQEQYYGFTQFAVELNELDSNLRPLLPPTDTRFRPDQRLLEEGNVEAAEEQKQRIENLQRERRKVLMDNNMTHLPRFFKKSKDDAWVTNGTYWELRQDPGFSKLDFSVLW